MSKKQLVAAAAGGLVAVAASVGVIVLAKDEPRERTDCFIRVFFAADVSQHQIDRIGSRLEGIEDVSVDFVSKQEALARMRERFPELTVDLPSNPLPDAYFAKTTYADSCSNVRAALRPRPPGVDNVNSTVRPYEESAK